MRMADFVTHQCPKCGLTQKAGEKHVVWHACPKNKNRETTFKVVVGETEEWPNVVQG